MHSGLRVARVVARRLQTAAAASPVNPVAARLASQILTSQHTDITIGHLEALLNIAAPDDIARVEKRAKAQNLDLDPLLRPLVGAYSAAGQRDEALRLLRQHRAGDSTAFDPLLVACIDSGNDDDLRAAYWLMREVGVTPSAGTYGALIRARVRRGEADRALRTCVMAVQEGRPPPLEAFDDLVEALVGGGLTGYALELAESLRTSGSHFTTLSPRATELLLDGAAASTLPLEALSVLRELRQHRAAAEAPRLATELLTRCVRKGNVLAARAVLRECDAERLPLSLAARDELVLALLAADDVPEAMRVFDAAGAHALGAQAMHADGGAGVAARRLAQPHATIGGGGSSGGVLIGGGGDVGGGGGGLSAVAGDASLGLELDLRGLPEGAARLSCVRYFQRLANATPTERLLAGSVLSTAHPSQSARQGDDWSETRGGVLVGGGDLSAPLHAPLRPNADGQLSLLLSDRSHAEAVVQQAAELSPPIALRPTTTRDGRIVLSAEADELARWARRCAEERLRHKRTSGLVMAAAGHNMAWTIALIAGAGALPF